MGAPIINVPSVLITGGNGFTGIHVASALSKRGWNVIKGTQFDTGRKNEVEFPLLEKEKMIAQIKRFSPDYIIHLAAISSVTHGALDEVYQVNLLGTLNLLQALDDAGCVPKKIVIASSGNVYGAVHFPVISEATQPLPKNHYAASKLAMESMVRIWFERFDIILTRPFNYTGLGQGVEFVIPKIVQHFLAKKHVIELGNINVSREFNDVRDVAEIYTQLLESDFSRDVVNVCSGNGYTLEQVIKNVSSLTGHDISVSVNPLYVRDGEIPKLVGDATKLKSVVNFSEFTPLNETLEWMLGNKT